MPQHIFTVNGSYLKKNSDFTSNQYEVTIEAKDETEQPYLTDTFSLVIGVEALGMDELTRKGIKIHPNPVQDKLNIHFLEKSSTSFNAKVIHSSGIILHEEYIAKQKESTTIDFSTYSPGAYFLKFVSTDAVFYVKIIKSE
jgi:hypothetical protein